MHDKELCFANIVFHHFLESYKYTKGWISSSDMWTLWSRWRAGWSKSKEQACKEWSGPRSSRRTEPGQSWILLCTSGHTYMWLMRWQWNPYLRTDDILKNNSVQQFCQFTFSQTKIPRFVHYLLSFSSFSFSLFFFSSTLKIF